MAILNNINEVLRRAGAGDTFVAAGYAVSGGARRRMRLFLYVPNSVRCGGALVSSVILLRLIRRMILESD